MNAVSEAKAHVKELRERANQYTLHNTVAGYDAFWGDDELVDLYLEPARIESFRMVAELAADWPGEVIDLGCGSGTMLEQVLLVDRTGRKRVTGIDFAPSSIRRCQRAIPKGTFLQADVCRTGLASDSFDVILSMQTMEHLPSPKEAFEEMWRLLRPGGRIVITVPDGSVDDWEGHKNFWTIESFLAMAGRPAQRAEKFNNDRNLLFVFQKPRQAASYRIAADLQTSRDLTAIDAGGRFAREIAALFARIRPKKIIETGTYHGTGTTTVIASALSALKVPNAQFFSIEINPKHLAKAQTHVAKAGLNVTLLHGLSVPRAMLPTIEQIEAAYVKDVAADGIVVDHQPADRARLYFGETDFPDLPDDLLGLCLNMFDGRPDFVLLDSGGHMGHVEFRYLIDNLRGPCHIALDDINHVKHYHSFKQIIADPRFQLVVQSQEKFGFCIAKFRPE